MLIPNCIFAQQNLKIEIDGDNMKLDTSPTIQDGRTIVPIEEGFFEKLGVQTSWDENKNTICLEDDDTLIKFTIDDKIAYIYNKNEYVGNDPYVVPKLIESTPQKINLDAAPEKINGVTYIPLRFAIESMGAKIDWDGKTRTIAIKSKASLISTGTPVSYQVLKKSDIKEKEELILWYEANHRVRGIYYKKVDSEIYVLINAGEKLTGGYSMDIESIKMISPGNIYISAKVLMPPRDAIVIQSLTYPNILVKLKADKIEKIQGNISKF